MQPRWTRRLGLTAIVGAVAWASIGCAQERDPINRVQPNALSKHFFVGADLSSPKDDPEFYMRNTVVDVPYGAGQDGLFTASYAQPITRVKWEITENTLVARQTYEHITDSDHNGSRRTDNGQVVAMFNISSHFDIKRSYNPQTGEELNIVEENTTDRPWYEREYMRVDWSKNLVTDGYEVDSLSQIGLFGGVKFDPMSYYVEDPTSPDAPAFDEKGGYFDVTTKSFATPQILDTPWGSFPACYFFGQFPVANCNPTEVKLRLSFRTVTDTDYEPAEWDGNRMDAFGWFYNDRYGYERNYGVLDEKWHKLAAKYNIWQKSHIEGSQCGVDFYRDADGNVAQYKTDGTNFLTDPNNGTPIPATPEDIAAKKAQPFPATPVGADPNRDSNTNKTADECEFHDKDGNLLHSGSRCDVLSHKCTLPLYERETKTIPWYYGPDSTPDLFASTAKALDEWNVAVKRAAEIGKQVTATRVGLDGSQYMTDENQLIQDNGATVKHIFTLCHNPTIETDNDACFGKDENGNKTNVYARVGDIRYNMVNIITNPQTPSPWGIMVDADDPLTGEKVSTSVNEWGHVLDLASQGTEDLLRWINGEITDDQITSGAYLRDWVKATSVGTKQYTPKVLSKDDIQKRLKSLSIPQLYKPSIAGSAPVSLKGMTRQDFDALTNKLAQTAAQQMGPSLDNQFEGVRQQLIGTKFESMMINGEDMEAIGMDPKTPLAGNDALVAKASPLRGMHPEMKRWLKVLQSKVPALRHFCQVEQPEPDALVGMARQAKRLYPLPQDADKGSPFYAATNDAAYPAKKAARDQALHQWIREQFHISVIAHEMGHSMGLRHNFTGTWDSLNYHTQYWQLRTRNGKEPVCQDVTTPHTDGSECVGPRWIDPVTDQETNGLIWKWGSSTVMDYPGDQSQDMNDIGKYDKAAMRFGYGDVVDIDAKATSGSSQGQFDLDRLDGFGGIVGPLDFANNGDLHYSMFQDKFDVLGKAKCTQQTDPNDPLSATCPGADLYFADFYDMQNKPGTNGGQFFAIDPKGHVRHPYMFGSDEFADFGNVPVFRFDSGADPYEQFQFVSSVYENRYIFDNFRRDKVTFNTESMLSRLMDRSLDKFDASYKALALQVSLYGSLSSTTDIEGQLQSFASGDLINKPGFMLPHVLAASDSFATWLRIMTRPEPGDYFELSPGTAEVPDVPPSGPGNSSKPLFHIAVGSGEGRYLHNDYDYSKGYDWSSYQTQIGSYYEKRLAVYYLMQAYNHFIQNNKRDYVDSRYLNINYATLYPEQMRRVFTQLMQNDTTTFGPFVTMDGAPQQAGGTPIGSVRYLPWELSDAVNYPQGAKVVAPLVGWEEQFPALIDGFVFGKSTLNMNWASEMRIFSPGGVDTVSIPLDQQTIYQDPMTGVRYAARDYGDEIVAGKQTARAMGARMLQYARNLAAATFKVASTDPVTKEQTYERDPVTQEPICKVDAQTCQANKVTIRNYSSNLDLSRELAAYLGVGPL